MRWSSTWRTPLPRRKGPRPARSCRRRCRSSRQGASTSWVRVNRETVEEDCEASVWPGLSGIILPKAEAPEDVQHADRVLGRLEEARGIPIGTTRIAATIETARGVRVSHAVAAASPRIAAGGVVGETDLAADLGLPHGGPMGRRRARLLPRGGGPRRSRPGPLAAGVPRRSRGPSTAGGGGEPGLYPRRRSRCRRRSPSSTPSRRPTGAAKPMACTAAASWTPVSPRRPATCWSTPKSAPPETPKNMQRTMFHQQPQPPDPEGETSQQPGSGTEPHHRRLPDRGPMRE